MTSEIIIMNTDVIALAADSTITINDKKHIMELIKYLCFQMILQWELWYLD